MTNHFLLGSSFSEEYEACFIENPVSIKLDQKKQRKTTYYSIIS